MQILRPTQALIQILQGLVGHHEHYQVKVTRPFFFIVGAGVSAEAVPTATLIQEHCRSVAARFGHASPNSTNALDTYSYWFEQAYAHAVDRQRYLRGLMEKKQPTEANRLLARVLESEQVANIAVTLNFDDLLERALSTPAAVCDNPAMVGRTDPEEHDNIQVVHVHGTYHFYDCCNLRDEISQRAKPSRKTTRTMSALLDRILARRSPIVIGYSGWQGDVVMGALERRLSDQRMRRNVYWFCYKPTNEGRLQERFPRWLTEHPDVRIVVPTREALSAVDVLRAMQCVANIVPAYLAGNGDQATGALRLLANDLMSDNLAKWLPLLAQLLLGMGELLCAEEEYEAALAVAEGRVQRAKDREYREAVADARLNFAKKLQNNGEHERALESFPIVENYGTAAYADSDLGLLGVVAEASCCSGDSLELLTRVAEAKAKFQQAALYRGMTDRGRLHDQVRRAKRELQRLGNQKT